VKAAERLERGLLADLPLRRLHELEDADRPALGPPPQGEPERRGGFAFHHTRVDDDERPVPALPGGQTVDGNGCRLTLRHQALLC
jgi:hypothetical protein